MVTVIYLLQNLLKIGTGKGQRYLWYVQVFITLIFVESVFGATGAIHQYPHIFLLTFPLHFILVPLLFKIGSPSQHYGIKQGFWAGWPMIAPMLSFGFFLPIYGLDTAEKIAMINGEPTILLFQMGLLIAYNFFIIYRFRREALFIVSRKSQVGRSILIGLLAYVMVTIASGIWIELSYHLYVIFLPILWLVMVFLVKGKLKSSKKADEMELLKKIELVMVQERIYTNTNLSLKMLSEYLNCTPNEVSKTINSQLSIGFNEYVNRFRVDQAIALIRNRDNEKFTLESLAKTAGFNSSTTFNKAFKQITGKTPKEFRKLTES